jgi:hypothetical protein
MPKPLKAFGDRGTYEIISNIREMQQESNRVDQNDRRYLTSYFRVLEKMRRDYRPIPLEGELIILIGRL